MQTLPAGPITVLDPVSNTTFDVRPLISLLHTRYGGDLGQLVGELQELSNYIMREPSQQDDARKLRQMFNLIADLSAAVDSVKVVGVA